MLKNCVLISLLLLLALALPLTLSSNEPNLEILAQWKNLAFSFDSPEQEEWALENGIYNPEIQVRPYDGDIFETADGRIRMFTSMPRITSTGGVPYTLAEVLRDTTSEKGPLLRAYPDTEHHLSQTCDNIISVFRMAVQQHCNLLYVVDSGRDFTRIPSLYCPPKVIVIDLLTDKVKYTYEIPATHYNANSTFNGITLLPSKNCVHAKAYIPDARGPGLLVLERNGKKFKSWRIYSDYFKVDPTYLDVTIANETFSFADGLYTAAPSIRNQMLYFHPMASLTEYAVYLPLLHFEEIWKHGFNLDFLFQVKGQRPTQSSIEAIDSRGKLWFTLMDPLAFFCWDTKKPYQMSNFKKVIENSEDFQYVAGLKIRKVSGLGEIILGTSNRLQKHLTGTVNNEEINYRIFMFSIENISC